MTDDELKKLRNDLHTQDNRATDNPLFIVEREERIYGMDGVLCDDLDFIWVNQEDSEYSYEPDEILEAIRDAHEDFGLNGMKIGTLNLWDSEIDPENFGYEKLFYVTRMEFVGAHFTEKAADLYIFQNNHNLRKPRTYVTSQYRCNQWIQIRQLLMSDIMVFTSEELLELRCFLGALTHDLNRSCESTIAIAMKPLKPMLQTLYDRIQSHIE